MEERFKGLDKATIEAIKQMEAEESQELAQAQVAADETLSSEDKEWAKSVMDQYKDVQKYGNRSLEAATQAAASAATFSLTDRLQQELGIRTAEDLRKLRELNPSADIAGTILGTAAPLLTPSGLIKTLAAPVTAASKAGLAVEKASTKFLLKQASKSGLKGTAKDVIKKSVAKGLGSAVEGAAFGTGQLLREDALGEAEINAENLAAFAGTGALFGGALGTALPAAASATGATLKAGSKLGKDAFGRLSKKISDPAEDAMDLLGYTPKMKANVLLNEAEKKTVSDLPRWLREDVGWKVVDNEQERLNKLMKLGQSSGAKVDDIMQQADSIGAQKFNPEDLAKARRELYQKVANDIDQEIFERLGDISKSNPARKKIESLTRDVYNKVARIKSDSRITAKEIRQLRNTIWDTYETLPFEERSSVAGSVLKQAYGKMAASLEAYVGKTAPELVDELRRANKNYSRFKRYKEPLAKRAAKDKNLVSFRDLVFGGVGYGAGGVPGVLIAGARKLLDSDLKRKIVVLSSVEKANKLAQEQTKRSVVNFFAKDKLPAVRAASVSALLKSNYSEERKDKKKAFKEISKNLQQLKNEPERLEQHVARATSALSVAAPETATHAASKLVNGLYFLESKLPRSVSEIAALGSGREYEPSSMELAKFERYFQAVENPMSVLQDLEQGTLTREHVEALAVVYPRFLEAIRSEVMRELEAGAKVPYNRRVQLGVLLDLPTDPSLSAASIMSLQASFGPKPEEAQAQTTRGAVKPTVGAMKDINFSERAQTETQRVVSKDE